MKYYTPYMMLIGLLIFSQNLYAAVFVAFFANPPQQPPLEKNAKFIHSAIYQNGKWIDSYPYYNVRISPQPPYPRADLLLVSPPQWTVPEVEFTKRLGQKFNMLAPWGSTQETYCSKLIAEIFNLPPEPMDFSSTFWDGWRAKGIPLPQGQPGLAPDDLIPRLIKIGFRVYQGRLP